MMNQTLKKASLSAVLAFALLPAGALPVYANEGQAPSPDYAGHWAEPLFKAWLQSGLIQGYEDGSFHPGLPVTRAELAVLLDRAYPSETAGRLPVPAGVPAGAWYEQSAAKAAAAGYLSADGAGGFRPGEPVSRAEAAALLAALLGWRVDAGAAGQQYKDAALLPQGEQRSWLLQAADGGFLPPSRDGYLAPYRPVSRAEAVLLLAQAKGTAPLGLHAPAFTEEREYAGTLQAAAGKGFRLLTEEDSGGGNYALSGSGASLAGSAAAAGTDGLAVRLTAVEGLAPERLQVLGISAAGTAEQNAASQVTLDGILLENHHSKLADPKKHPKDCLFMPDCALSGFGISVLQPAGTYKYYKFDTLGHQLAVVLIDSITKDSDIAIHAVGIVDGDTLRVSRLYRELDAASSGERAAQEAGDHTGFDGGSHSKPMHDMPDMK